MPLIDIAGRRFGRLIVIERVGRSFSWLARCDCGGAIVAEGANIRSGKTSSCGCARCQPRLGVAPPLVAGCRWIALTQGQFALVDEDLFASLGARAWHAHATRCGDYYACSGARGAREWMHRTVLGVGNDAERVDHINGDKLDNRRANLRIATSSEDAQNSRRRATPTSPYRGVSRRDDGWMARITRGRQTRLIGIFPTDVAAAIAYDAAARSLFGRHARVNFPQEISACR